MDMVDLPLILIISYPRRYAPVIFAITFSSFETGYDIVTSFGCLISPDGVMERLSEPVSISTSSLFSNLFVSIHSFGSETRILLPIFCRRRMNLVSLNQYK
jgi:hypothetical protein